MRIMVIGATGLLGTPVARALEGNHEVLRASLNGSAFQVDFANPESIRNLYIKGGQLDAVVSVAGQAVFRPLSDLSDADLELGLKNKLMGQINLVRLGIESLKDGGSFTLTSGQLSRWPVPGAAAVSIVNAGVEAFARAAALELPRGLRINAVAPGWVRETLVALKMDPTPGIPAAEVAQTYVKAVEGKMNGQTLDVVKASS
jgi:NAD(P)-dependent dehydrogenase (short-subunit alcohol dehydrogenase family)